MKVVIISTSDNKGGAAIVATRLLNQLTQAGIEARMLAMHKYSDNPLVIQYGNNLKKKLLFLAERAHIFVNNQFSRENLFKVSTARFGFDLSRHPLILGADVIILNWINQGALSLKSIERICKLGKPVLWIMHDMWQATGICHHSLGCKRYFSGMTCGRCNFLQSHNETDLSHSILLRKKSLYTENKNLLFIAISNWIKSVCDESELLSSASIHCIPNAFPINEFDYKREHTIKSIPTDKCVIVMGAARLDMPIKGLDILIEATKILATTHSEEATRFHLVTYGDIRNMHLLNQIAISHTHLGPVSRQEDIAEIYRNGDIVVSTSMFETLPTTIIEGAASGCTPVTFGNSGQTDIVTDGSTGYIADYLSAESIASKLIYASHNLINREYLHKYIEDRYSARAVAMQYNTLFKTLLHK
ncbi:MAG: glycosyltransferase [Muribaculaceae bacterium]|nr:glycosyltransferase [Muribaculaceae bacterium]